MPDRGRVRGPRMAKHWHFLAGSVNSLTGDTTILIASLALDGPFTVLRMLGEYTIGLSAVPVAADTARVCVGIGVVSTDAAALGSTAVPDPDAEPDYPWLYWRSHPFNYPSAASEPASEQSGVRTTFDVKSMRKLKPRESLALIAQYVDVSGAPPLTLASGVTRVLVAT